MTQTNLEGNWKQVPDHAQYKGADWKNKVKRINGIKLEEAKEIGALDPTVSFFFYVKGGQMVLEGKGVFRHGDAVFFSGKPWYGTAPDLADSYEKPLDLKLTYLEPAFQEIQEIFPKEEPQIQEHRAALIEHLSNQSEPAPDSPILKLNHSELISLPPVPITACDEAIAIAIVEAILFLFGAKGLKISNEERVARAIFRELGPDTLRGLSRAIVNFNEAQGAEEKAKALFALVGGIYNAGGFRAVLKALKHELSWWEWFKISAIMVAQLTAWLATDGVAFVAEVSLTILGATDLIEACAKVAQQCQSA